jgi:hypothetical protein
MLNKIFEKNRRVFIYTLLCIDIVYLFMQFSHRSVSVGSDFIHFYYSSKRLFMGESVFFPGGDTLAFSSSVTYIFFIPLTSLEPLLASNIFIMINYCLIVLVVISLMILINKKLNLNSFVITLSLVIYSFPSRSIIANGQIGFAALLFALFFLISMKRRSYQMAGISLWLLYEFKIYLAAPIFLLLLLKRNYKPLLTFCVYFAMGQILVFFINPSAMTYHYFKLIFQRVNSLDSEIDQVALQNILINLGLFRILSWTLSLIILFYISFRVFKVYHFNFNPELLLAFIPLCSIYFHRQDAIFGVISLCILMLIYEKNKLLLPLILLGNWGGDNFTLAFGTNLLLLLTLFVHNLDFKQILLVIIGCIFLQYGQISIKLAYGWQTSYLLWVILTYIFQMKIFLSALSISRQSKERFNA